LDGRLGRERQLAACQITNCAANSRAAKQTDNNDNKNGEPQK
jgi:hypothetical protein